MYKFLSINLKKFSNKLVKVITIYGEEIIGIVIEEPILVLHLKTDNGIIVIDLEDIDDIILIGEVVGDDKV